MRICFYRPALPFHLNSFSFPFQLGLSQSTSTLLSEHDEIFSLTGNKGNMIHRLAALQGLDCDRTSSIQANLPRLLSRVGTKEFSGLLENNFDAVVITMSNAVRRGPSDGALLPAIKHINIPIYVVGLGLQQRLDGGLNELDEDMAELLRLLNEKAVLFGVRGHSTRRWLSKANLTNAQALGCPSMFAYPINIAKLKAPEKVDRYFVAGHLEKRYLNKKSDRAVNLIKAFQGRSCAYVFQDELPTYDIKDHIGLYDEATGKLDQSTVADYIEKIVGIRPPFHTYYSFNEAGSWRQAALHYDVYIGDRIHGGVAAMQAGVPALILYEDTRVAELTEYHGIPSCRVSEFAELGVEAAISKYLGADAITKFKTKYADGLRKYQKVMTSAGLRLANDLEINEALMIIDSKPNK